MWPATSSSIRSKSSKPESTTAIRTPSEVPEVVLHSPKSDQAGARRDLPDTRRREPLVEDIADGLVDQCPTAPVRARACLPVADRRALTPPATTPRVPTPLVTT